jgi:hypothetical protein
MQIDKLSRIENEIRQLVPEDLKKLPIDKIRNELLSYLRSAKASDPHSGLPFDSLIENITKDCKEFERNFATYTGRREKDLLAAFKKIKRQFALQVVKIRLFVEQD